MRVLLCLLSAQHVPNLLSVHHYQPDRLVLIESHGMQKKRAAANLLAALKLGGLDYANQPGGERSHVEPLENEDDLEAIRRALRQAYARYPGAEWLVNVTGATKPMSIATYDFFNGLIRRGVLSGQLLYTNMSQPERIIDLENHSAVTCTHRLSIKQFLAGYGFESRKADRKLAEAEARARSWWECSRAIAQRQGTEPVLALSDEERGRARSRRGFDLKPGHVHPTCVPVLKPFADCFSLQIKNGELCGKIDKYAGDYLTGGWLEAFLWGVLDRQAGDLGIWDVRLGMDIGRVGDATGNDFDVSFMRANGLCMIECKSGSQAHDPQGDVLYRIEAVIRQFRALRVQSWLATTSANLLDRQTGDVKTHIATRANIYGCHLILHDQIVKLAENPDDVALLQSVLFSASNDS
ncbi:MAG: DUF1887 family CARF protein [Pirellulales bacterium]|jgi:hypothetical protein|nr:DUF1887 family CARF protein [Thermoguttaceae bacterium]MDD4787282.1 DUF1887 family CARF protein [Pirellulales bacterium]MDI9445231.1 DUF1887 family CARF protein [Planctomycetota bacterium]NLY99391.1 DUF1887 family protein [Pirellulaceae bacterium]